MNPPVSLKYFYGALFQDVFPFGLLFAFCAPFVEVNEICDLCFNLLGSGRSLDAMKLFSKLTISLLSSRSRGKFHSKRTPFLVVREQARRNQGNHSGQKSNMNKQFRRHSSSCVRSCLEAAVYFCAFRFFFIADNGKGGSGLPSSFSLNIVTPRAHRARKTEP